MGDKTKIEWTDASWNPVTGCSKVSQGCKNCYAEDVADRFWERQYPMVLVSNGQDINTIPVAHHADYIANGLARPRRFTDVQCHANRLGNPLAWKRPRRIFVNSMSDLFHESVPFEFIDQVFAVMALARWHTFQILTKRSQRMLEYFGDTPGRDGTLQTAVRESETGMGINIEREMRIREAMSRFSSFVTDSSEPVSFPLPNVWIGVSVENQEQANARIPDLLKTPAAVHWVSCEPLLDVVDLREVRYVDDDGVECEWDALIGQHQVLNSNSMDAVTSVDDGNPRLRWVVAGFESGQHFRPAKASAAVSLRDQCEATGVAFLFKQWGGRTPKSGGRVLEGKTYDEYP
jgi:protein gp37